MSDSGDSIERLRRELRRYKTVNEAADREIRELRRLLEAAHHREKALRSSAARVAPDTVDDVINPEEERERTSSAHERVRPDIIDEVERLDEGNVAAIETGEVPNALCPHPGWGNLSSADKSGIVIGVSLLGLDVPKQEEFIELVAKQALRARQLFPLFITDTDDFRYLRSEHFVFEYLPPWPGERIRISKENWERFLIDRLSLIRRKWAVRRFVSFHRSADARSAGADKAKFAVLGNRVSEDS